MRQKSGGKAEQVPTTKHTSSLMKNVVPRRILLVRYRYLITNTDSARRVLRASPPILHKNTVCCYMRRFYVRYRYGTAQDTASKPTWAFFSRPEPKRKLSSKREKKEKMTAKRAKEKEEKEKKREENHHLIQKNSLC